MSIRRRIAIILLFAGAAPLSAQTQGIAGPRASALTSLRILPDSTPHYYPIYQTYAREGALITGIPFGLGATALVGAFCQDTDSGGDNKNCGIKGLEAGIITAGITGMVGAFIGSSFHRNPMIPDSVVGDHGSSLGVGFAIAGFAAGTITAHGDCTSNCFGETAKAALVTAIVGGAVGYAFGSLFPRYVHH